MTIVTVPLAQRELRELRVGQSVRVTGVLYAGRAPVLEYLGSGGHLTTIPPGSVFYHSAPVAKKKGKVWTVSSLGPDFSPPLDAHMRDMVVRCGIRGFIGRGELSKSTLEVFRQQGACYFHAIGGAGVALARRIKEVRQVHQSEKLDDRDGLWEILVEDFPAVITIDSYGQSLHEMIRDVSTRRMQALLA